jgi:hypothetical protein
MLGEPHTVRQPDWRSRSRSTSRQRCSNLTPTRSGGQNKKGRMDMRRFLLGVALAGALGLGGVAVVAGPAGATNIDVSEENLCRDNSQWLMTFSAVNTHDTPLHIRLDTTQGPGTIRTLAPKGQAGSSYSTSFVGSTGGFTWTWSTTDGILVGTPSGTFTRPEGCDLVPTSTSPSTTSTVPPSTTVPPPVVESAPPITPAPPPSVPAPPPIPPPGRQVERVPAPSGKISLPATE